MSIISVIVSHRSAGSIPQSKNMYLNGLALFEKLETAPILLLVLTSEVTHNILITSSGLKGIIMSELMWHVTFILVI